MEQPPLNATEEDWSHHINQLKQWVSNKPYSTTAYVALARAYGVYAWRARGNGYANTVSQSGWRLFAERGAEARRLLDKAATFPTKCPEWFTGMQDVARIQGWDLADMRRLVEQAMAFEPGYYYYYRMHADFLLPRWYGEIGDSEKYVAEVADSIGGDEGDAIYFQVATYVFFLPGGKEAMEMLGRMSWPRMQKGFAVLEKQYGVSLMNMNTIAYVAIRANDNIVAQKMFDRIGDQFDLSSWGSKENFDEAKRFAKLNAEREAWRIAQEQEAETNMRTSKGVGYKKAFDKKFKNLVRQCVETAGADSRTFEMLVSIDKEGIAQPVFWSRMTSVAECVVAKLSIGSRYTPFPPPPRHPYLVRADVDPSSLVR
jgi:hypothetical protein